MKEKINTLIEKKLSIKDLKKELSSDDISKINDFLVNQYFYDAHEKLEDLKNQAHYNMLLLTNREFNEREREEMVKIGKDITPDEVLNKLHFISNELSGIKEELKKYFKFIDNRIFSNITKFSLKANLDKTCISKTYLDAFLGIEECK